MKTRKWDKIISYGAMVEQYVREYATFSLDTNGILSLCKARHSGCCNFVFDLC